MGRLGILVFCDFCVLSEFKLGLRGLLAIIDCLVMIELCFGMVLVVCMREQGRNSTIFTQASHSRLSKDNRNSSLVLVRASRSGDQLWC